MRSALLVLSVALVLGCGGDDGGASLGAPTCNPGELVLEGTFDGALVNDQRTGYNTFSFVNAVGSANGMLNIGFPTQEGVLLEFPDFVNDGKKVRARAFINLAAGGGIFGGFCDTMSSYTAELLVPKAGGQYEFHVTELRAAEPFCTANLVQGDIVGCFRPRETPDAGL